MPAPRTGNAVVLPPLFEQGHGEEFRRSGKALSLEVSPRDNAIAIYAKPNPDPQGSRTQSVATATPSHVYFAALHRAPTSERRVFVIDTYVIFNLVQSLKKDARDQDIEVSKNEDALEVVAKLALDYVNFCKECCMYCASPSPREPLQLSAEHYSKLYTCFSLFAVLYTPHPGHEDAPVGDELMEWLNTHYVEPTTEEGDHLSSLDRPWEDETFWPYLTRYSELCLPCSRFCEY